MHTERRKQLLFGIFLLCAAVIIAVWTNANRVDAQAPGPGYFKGAMRNKANPNLWVTEDGKIVPPPPGAKIIAAPPKRSQN